ncbi:MAG TPA: M1 family aminopeptidase, partial [Thermoanaerobaculia bacterium]|nr:M1 family aminopeptidase [Thermoanaerobaculia bacterium]
GVTHDGRPAVWHLGTEFFGAPLTIELPPGTRSITIDYATHPAALGLVWSNASDTTGGVKPFLFSFNAPIGARSWIPIHDTPAARMTFDATLRVTPGLLALMTAEDNPRVPNGDGVYRFTMSQSIPAYLIAFAVAPLEYRAIDGRIGVYAEANRILDAAWELQYLPAMMDAAEELLGPHPFPRHDLLIMPPSFPAGGMENPMLNFIQGAAIPTGRIGVPPEPRNLIAHELAHSWAGDATTLSTWHDVWINEGFASYLALRILEELRGPESVRQRYVNDRLLVETYVRGARDPQQTVLHRRSLRDPAAAFDVTSYVKGELFLRTLEDLLGRSTFDAFLRDWYATYAFRWVDDRNFLAMLRKHAGIEGIIATSALEWLYQPGLPANVTVPRQLSTEAVSVEEWVGCHTARAPHPPSGHLHPSMRGAGFVAPRPAARGEGGRRPGEGSRHMAETAAIEDDVTVSP